MTWGWALVASSTLKFYQARLYLVLLLLCCAIRRFAGGGSHRRCCGCATPRPPRRDFDTSSGMMYSGSICILASTVMGLSLLRLSLFNQKWEPLEKYGPEWSPAYYTRLFAFEVPLQLFCGLVILFTVVGVFKDKIHPQKNRHRLEPRTSESVLGAKRDLGSQRRSLVDAQKTAGVSLSPGAAP
ncbi:unnamed protein product [Amoebophrya sp. A25]|nr:unnamed protein product [Amoebophrya sp. A25]|eukprot:GSA25T00013964001.1